MIIDLQKFIRTEQPFWEELEQALARQERDPYRRMSFDEIQRLHYLYQRAAADLAKIDTYATERATHDYLESLVGRAYGLVYGAQQKPVRFAPLRWFWRIFPNAFRRRRAAFALSLGVMLLGSLFGGAAILVDPEAKAILMPFPHLLMDPSERVAQEENAAAHDRLKGSKSTFSAFLMTHNTRVSILVLALGMTWGIGTVLVLFTNGVMLGAVAADYVQAGESLFLAGWLLPHGVVEIPAILVAGQAGLLLAGALIGVASNKPMADRLRAVGPDVVTLIGGVALMLVWAGVVEAFFSQYHAPVIAYEIKIAFGAAELLLLVLFLRFAGRNGHNIAAQRQGESPQRATGDGIMKGLMGRLVPKRGAQRNR